MSKIIKQLWRADLVPGLPRRHRKPCEYEAYVPDSLAGRGIALDGDVAADVADAEAAIVRFNSQASALVDTEALARLLLRAESIASSKIEGLEVGGRRLLRAEVASQLGDRVSDVTAAEVLGNIDAMIWAVETVAAKPHISVADICEIHRRLLANTPQADHAGRLRREQNWIGGSDYNPCSAEFVPPPPERVLPLLEDLCAFCEDDHLPPLVQAAVAHAQFETIHPFVDGNGRTGRALVHIVMRRRGIADRILPPVSLILATWARDYVSALTGTRYVGSPRSRAAHDGYNRWIALFSAACSRAVADAVDFEARLRALQQEWHEALGSVRKGSAVDRLVARLPATPVLTVNTAAALIGRTFQATNLAVERLVAASILVPITLTRRNRAFEAPALIDAFRDFERQLSSPAGNTRVSAPARRVPRRRQAP